MSCMTVTDAKTNLRGYLQDAREALLWKLDGLSEYDIHAAARTSRHEPARAGQAPGRSAEFGYLGDTFGRPA